ncbi:MAG TPA: nitrilase-related carbon-nitrogen hydrolase, partial [Thermoanaerobaculia bacterium]|nr:nitrilase-related carbon-nitrogen hydrolase [Thermoanaerobaculia bacterium]
MTEESSLLTVGLAQIDCLLGDIAANLDTHLAWIAKARERGVELLVFPELSLTGYRLLHLTPRVALRADSPEVARLAAAAGGMAVVVGFVEEDERGVLHNSAVLLKDGEAAFVHRKIYLPTYGIFQDKRFFAAGHRLELAPGAFGGSRLGILICEDLWHPQLAARLAAAGAKLVVVISAGPGRIGSGAHPESCEIWETLTRATAIQNTCWVVYCNRV